MKYGFVVFLVVFLVMGMFSGIYAVGNQLEGGGVVTGHVVGSKIVYVAKNGTDRNDGLTFGKPKRNIQSAINSASAGDIIKIGPGVYNEVTIEVSKNLTIEGSNQNNTVIDAQQQAVRCVHVQQGVNATIMDLTLKNSDIRNARTYYYSGAGIYNEGTLTLIKSTITRNNAQYGGGIENTGLMTINNSTIEINAASRGFGGGIDNDGTMVINNSRVDSNQGMGFGGGIYSGGPLNVTNSIITNNRASDDGGGICSNGPVYIEDSIISNNSANKIGGGIRAHYAVIYGCVISNNHASNGGGIFNRFRAYVDDASIIINNTPNNFAGNPITPA